jgi:alpha-D-ribose 1-methylphosphonate 5-triphosphate synthase subunit PhnL
MQQRLQIARVLVTRAALVFMDEPTGGLDVSVQARLLDLLRGWCAISASPASSSPTISLSPACWRDRLMVMRRGQHGGGRPDRPAARRSAACLYAIAHLGGADGMSKREHVILGRSAAETREISGKRCSGQARAWRQRFRHTLVTAPAQGTDTMTTMIHVENVAKEFTLHNQGGVRLPVFDNVNFSVAAGEALVLAGASGAGKSSLLRILYGNYRPTSGTIAITHGGRPIDIVSAVPRTVLDIRRRTLGFVSQFLRVIPRVTALDIVRDPLLARGASPEEASERAKAMLARLNLPQRLWDLAPATFSGGEQQRVNIARSFVDPSRSC